MKAVFTTLRLRIGEVSQAKTVERWNNQITEGAREKLPRFPAVYVELVNLTARDVPPGVQHVAGTLRVRLFCKSLNLDDDSVLDLEQAVYLKLQNFRGGPLLTGLTRQRIYPDDNRDAIEQLVIEYAIQYADDAVAQARIATATARVDVQQQ